LDSSGEADDRSERLRRVGLLVWYSYCVQSPENLPGRNDVSFNCVLRLLGRDAPLT
jgi:hypothetical protein